MGKKKNVLKRRIGEAQNEFKILEEAQGILQDKRQKLKLVADKCLIKLWQEN